MSDDRRIAAVLQVIADHARRDPHFLAELERALRMRDRTYGVTSPARGERPHRRAPAVIDPFEVLHADGADGLRERLNSLSLDQLRDIVAEYRIEPYTLAMKWKTPGRIADLIVSTIDQRSRKGEVFRSLPSKPELSL
jgi:hypothetical protein